MRASLERASRIASSNVLNSTSTLSRTLSACSHLATSNTSPSFHIELVSTFCSIGSIWTKNQQQGVDYWNRSDWQARRGSYSAGKWGVVTIWAIFFTPPAALRSEKTYGF